MAFINKVTVKGKTYNLENLTDGTHIARLPVLTKDDVLVTETSLSKNIKASELTNGTYTVRLPSNLHQNDEFVLKSRQDVINNSINNKVDKVAGKGLSTNDYTTADKNKLDSLENYTLPTASPTVLGGVSPVTKTDEMTQEVGVDGSGKLYSIDSSYSIEIVDVLPEKGKENVFYLIPSKLGIGYEKFWWIKDNEGNNKWDEFKGSSTLIVTELPETGVGDIDYILKSEAGCMYYKWIDEKWEIIAGSMASIVEQLPETGNENVDYYVLNANGLYSHYRYINGEFKSIGGNSYTKDEIDEKIKEVTDEVAGFDSKISLLDNSIAGLRGDIDSNATNILALSSTIDSLTQKVDNIDTEGYTYYATYGNATLEATGEDAENVFTLYEVKKEEESIKSQFVITGGGGGGTSSSTITFERITPSPIVFTKEDKVLIEYMFSSIDADGDTVDGTYIWKLGSQVLASGNLIQGKNSIDLTEYATIGTQKFSLTIADEAGSMLVKTWNVQVVDVRIESDFKDNRTYEAGKVVNFTYKPYGSIQKTVHFILDGVELDTVSTTASGTQQSYVIPAQEHGTHLLECYITAVINGIEIETEHIFRDIIWYNSESKSPVIGCIYRYDHYGAVESKQYNTLSIEFNIFDQSTSTPTVELYEDEKLVSTLTIEGTKGIWTYKSSAIGEHILKIKCKETIVEIRVNIVELGIDVEPITANLAFDFNPVGKSNSDVDRLWTDANTGVTMSVSDNFDWSNGGYQIDLDGNQYFCVKAGTTATINYNLFENNQVMSDGAEFKFVFKVTNVGDPTATFLTCKSGGNSPVGIEMNAHTGHLYAGNTNGLDIPYSEDDIIEFEYNINTLDLDDSTAESFIMTYEDGVGYRPMPYSSANRLYQQSPVPIVIGSKDCDVYIYRMKAYTSYLSNTDILSNFIADAQSAEEMIARYNRNQIYDENGNLNPDKLAEACPQLKIIKITCPKFTADKDEKIKDTTIQCVHTGGDPVLDNWTAINCSHSGQGTTSNRYGISARNLRLIMNNDNTEITMGDGITKYYNGEGKVTLTRNSVPNNFFNLKVNVASSENANNALLAKRYDEFLPYMTPAKRKDPKTKTTMEFVNAVVFIRETGDVSEHREFQDNEWHFYALGNLGDDKKTDKTRVTNSKDPNEYVIELMDNTLPLSKFPSGQDHYPIAKADWKAGNSAYDAIWTLAYDEGEFSTFGDTTYEFRYEMKGITDEQRTANIQAWCDMYGWIVTATDEEFKNELGNWFVKDAALYFYLFTERYTMTDNRAKNTFWHRSKFYISEEEAAGEYADTAQYYTIDNEQAAINNGYRFDFWNYDNDTALGIDNNGVLNRPYGKEDIDLDEKGLYIFNAGDSTFFMRIRNLMYEDLKRVYNSVSDAWSATNLLNEFDNWQAEFPEELWRLDLERKYYRPFIGTSIDNSIPKLDKSYLKERYNGRKKYHRRQFERDQEIYMGTKYLATSVTSDTNDIRFRVTSPDNPVVPCDYTLKITPYSDMYLSAAFGNTAPKQIRAKAGQEYSLTAIFEDANDTMVNIYAANRIQALDGLSTCYINTNNFGNATKLKKLIIGNHTEGYFNPSMEELTLGNNFLLDTLDLKNCIALKGDLNMSKLNNLETLIADGTSLENITFATNGKIKTAILPNTVKTVIMKNLNYLTDLTLPTDSLDNFTEENSIVDEKVIVEDSIDTLTELRLVGIDWTVSDTSLLNQILKLYKSHLSGTVHVAGYIRQTELDAYAKAWPDLDVSYNAILTQYLVTFMNSDGSPIKDKLGNNYTQWVDQGAKAYDPIKAGEVDTPTIPSTEQYNYTFTKWDGIEQDVLTDITVTATYSSKIRTYLVRWFKQPGVLLKQLDNVEYGSCVEYGDKNPTMTENEGSKIYNIFTGWDKSTGFISGNIDVYAKWATANNLPPAGTQSYNMTPVQIYAVSRAKQADQYFADKDYIDVKMGNDVSFSNVEEFTLGEELYFDKTDEKVVDTGIKLFGENDTSFTIAIDFEFGDNDRDATLLSCFEYDGSEGFRLRYNGSNPELQWGNINETVGVGKQRDMLVIRHIKGTNSLHVYSFNGGARVTGVYADNIKYTEITRSRETSTEATIMLGAFKFLHNNVLDDNGQGYIHWAKVWLEDLGDPVARQLVAWPHETWRFNYYSSEYRSSEDSSRKTGASFVSENLLSLSHRMNADNSNVGGWDKSEMRTFCNNRIYKGFSIEWKSIIGQFKIPTSEGNRSNNIIESNDYIYLPSYVELTGIQDTPYLNEGNHISFFTTSASRAKTQNGLGKEWWSRSPIIGYANYFVSVTNTGDCGNSYITTNSASGICPCFSV